MVTYLNPLVLRKELENMFENDGISTLQFPDVVQAKPDIFWNLVRQISMYFFFLTEVYSCLYFFLRNSGNRNSRYAVNLKLGHRNEKDFIHF